MKRQKKYKTGDDESISSLSISAQQAWLREKMGLPPLKMRACRNCGAKGLGFYFNCKTCVTFKWHHRAPMCEEFTPDLQPQCVVLSSFAPGCD